MHRILTLGLALVLAGALGACTSDDDPPPPAATETASCTPMPVVGDQVEGGSDDGTSVWAILQRTEGGPVQVGEEVKVVVRMTGEGDLEVSATQPDGGPTEIDWGPESHGSSSFKRPGAEWGFGVTFTEPGCWTIALDRTESGSGYLQLEVV